MSFKYVVAIVWPEFVTPLEDKLKSIGIGGITLSKVKGFGEYKNLFTNDWLTEHTKVEILLEESKVDAVLEALRELAGCDIPGSGIVAVVPVETFLHLRPGTRAIPASPQDSLPPRTITHQD